MFLRSLLILFSFFALSCTSKYARRLNKNVLCPPEQINIKSLESSLGLSIEKLKAKTGMYSLEEGGESLIIRAWLCDAAQKKLDIQYYIFSRDNTGLLACDFLVRAADRGVKIRLIIDDATAKMGRREIYNLDSHKNIEIKVYNPGVILGSISMRVKKLLTEPHRFHRRMHVKTITVDDKASIIGGRNIADEYFDYHKEYNFRDRDVLLVGPTVKSVIISFEEYWNDKLCVPYKELVYRNRKESTDTSRFDKLHKYACDTQNFSPRMRDKIKNFPQHFKKIMEGGRFVWIDEATYMADPPGKNEDRKNRMGGPTTDSIIALIRTAKKTVDIQSPYLITTDLGKNLFRELTERGVKVRILTNSLLSTDNDEAFSGYQRDREEFLKTGVEVYEFKPDAAVRYKIMSSEVQSVMSYTPVFGMHSKTMIIDDRITVIGSYNLDPRSANLNTECISIFRSPEVAKVVGKYVDEEFLPENAWRITPNFNPDSKAGRRKRLKSYSRKVFPKDIL